MLRAVAHARGRRFGGRAQWSPFFEPQKNSNFKVSKKLNKNTWL
jgi:hypothetical protein